MAERQAFIDRVKGTERESYVVTAAVAHFRPVALAGDARLLTKTSPRDLIAAADQVGGPWCRINFQWFLI